MQENAKSVIRLDDAAIAAFKEKYAGVPEPWPAELKKKARAEAKALVPPRRERRAKWRGSKAGGPWAKAGGMPWSMLSLGRVTHRLEPEIKLYAKSTGPGCCDFSGIDACEDAEEKRARKRQKWGEYVNRSR